MKKIILMMLAVLFFVSCESDKYSEAEALLEKADQMDDNKPENSAQAVSANKTQQLEALNFKFAASTALIELRSWLNNQDYLEGLESRLKKQTNAGEVELASIKYQDGKKETEQAEATYLAAVKKMEESSPDLKKRNQVLHYLRQYRVRDAEFRAEIATAKAAKSLTGKENPELVLELESAYKVFKNLSAEEWMVDVKF